VTLRVSCGSRISQNTSAGWALAHFWLDNLDGLLLWKLEGAEASISLVGPASAHPQVVHASFVHHWHIEMIEIFTAGNSINCSLPCCVSWINLCIRGSSGINLNSSIFPGLAFSVNSEIETTTISDTENSSWNSKILAF
jgi:hypothetical protein